MGSITIPISQMEKLSLREAATHLRRETRQGQIACSQPGGNTHHRHHLSPTSGHSMPRCPTHLDASRWQRELARGGTRALSTPALQPLKAWLPLSQTLTGGSAFFCLSPWAGNSARRAIREKERREGVLCKARAVASHMQGRRIEGNGQKEPSVCVGGGVGAGVLSVINNPISRIPRRGMEGLEAWSLRLGVGAVVISVSLGFRSKGQQGIIA